VDVFSDDSALEACYEIKHGICANWPDGAAADEAWRAATWMHQNRQILVDAPVKLSYNRASVLSQFLRLRTWMLSSVPPTGLVAEDWHDMRKNFRIWSADADAVLNFIRAETHSEEATDGPINRF
jgi:hypothetical protein